MLYAGMITFVGSILLYALSAKTVLELNVIAERNPLYVQPSDGGIRNTVPVKILNKQDQEHTFDLSIDGLPGAKLTVLGQENAAKPSITVVPDDLREVRAYVTVPAAGLDKIDREKASFRFVVTDIKDGNQNSRTTNFRRP